MNNSDSTGGKFYGKGFPVPADTNKTCVFCGAGTNFEYESKAYCIDCYTKLLKAGAFDKTIGKLPDYGRVPMLPQVQPTPTLPTYPDFPSRKRPWEIGDYPNPTRIWMSTTDPGQTLESTT